MLYAEDQKLAYEIAAKIETLKKDKRKRKYTAKGLVKRNSKAARKKDEMQTARETWARSEKAEYLPPKKAQVSTNQHLNQVLGQTLWNTRRVQWTEPMERELSRSTKKQSQWDNQRKPGTKRR